MLSHKLFPLLLGVHHKLGGDGKGIQIPGECPAFKGRVSIAHDGDQIEVAAHSPVTTGIGTKIAKPDELRVVADFLQSHLRKACSTVSRSGQVSTDESNDLTGISD